MNGSMIVIMMMALVLMTPPIVLYSIFKRNPMVVLFDTLAHTVEFAGDQEMER